MRPLVWLQVSLARKISVLFGTAVLLTIAVTLIFPWFQMSALNQQAMLLSAKQIANAARQAVDSQSPDWDDAQTKLEQRWPLLSAELALPPLVPLLVREGSDVGPGFQQQAIDRLNRHPTQRYYWRLQRGGRFFRFASAVRAAETDPYPQKLLGIIDVRLPIQREGGVWNSVVTLLAGASGAVLAILVFYMVTQRLVLSPVRTLRRVAENVATGDIEVRSSIASGDEFQELSDAFNDMLTHLKAAQDAQQKINRSLDIRLGELAETNLALYESNRLKSEFLTNVTHELRTPLISIIGFAELLGDAWKNSTPDPKRHKRFAKNILASGRSLLDIINDLLDLAKIEAGKLELHVSTFSVDDLCRDLIDFVHPLADKRNHQLTIELEPELPSARTDSGKVKQILYNLLSNAIKFTPTGGHVSLVVERCGARRIRLAIRDTGPGIPPDRHKVIFEKFHQLDASEAREHEGTGLGLAITRDLVQMLGGTIEIQSSVGQGSTFIVELPTKVPTQTVRKRIRAT